MSLRALIQRINRALARSDEVLRSTRGDRWRSTLGDYYVLDINRNLVCAKHVVPEDLGRELGVLREYETLVED